MKKLFHSTPNWAAFVTFGVSAAIFGFSSCGSGGDPAASKPSIAQAQTSNAEAEAENVCGAQIFNVGRPLSPSELAASENMDFELREFHFRDVLTRGKGELELAYRVKMQMQANDGFLVPVHSMECNEQNKPSKRALKLSRTMIPVVGDLHLPSSLITVYDRASAESDNYNYPRIAEITVSSGGYFSFNNQNWAPYRPIRTIGQYLNLLRTRSLFSKVELREMGDGWLGVYAEKNIGGERSQLMVLLSRAI